MALGTDGHQRSRWLCVFVGDLEVRLALGEGTDRGRVTFSAPFLGTCEAKFHPSTEKRKITRTSSLPAPPNDGVSLFLPIPCLSFPM